jgi:nucleoside phosphorylase
MKAEFIALDKCAILGMLAATQGKPSPTRVADRAVNLALGSVGLLPGSAVYSAAATAAHTAVATGRLSADLTYPPSYDALSYYSRTIEILGSPPQEGLVFPEFPQVGDNAARLDYEVLKTLGLGSAGEDGRAVPAEFFNRTLWPNGRNPDNWKEQVLEEWIRTLNEVELLEIYYRYEKMVLGKGVDWHVEERRLESWVTEYVEVSATTIIEKTPRENLSGELPNRLVQEGGRKNFDVAIIIPLMEEFYVLEALCPAVYSESHDAIYYHTLKIAASDYRVVAVVIGEMGPTPASHITEKVLGHIETKVVVLLGLGGALDKDLKLGDVVVASEVNEFLASSKVVPQGDSFKFEYSGRHWQTPFALTQLLGNFNFVAKELYDTWRGNVTRFRGTLKLSPEKLTFTRDLPTLAIGHIASGNSVGASKAYAIELHGIDRKFQALEMEAAGVLTATQGREVPVKTIILRGISDFSDERKRELDQVGNGVWRRYAMYGAATLLLTLLKARDFQKIVGNNVLEATPHSVVAQIQSKGGKAIAVQGDVPKQADAGEVTLRVLGHWITMLIAGAACTVSTFVTLGGLPLSGRFLIIGLACLIVYAGVLTRAWRRIVCKRTSIPLLVGMVMAAAMVCALAIFMLHLTILYHNVTYSRTASGEDANAGVLQFSPSQFPSDLSVMVSVLQRNKVRIDQITPEDCNPRNPIRLDIEDPGAFQARYVLTNFVHPQCFRLRYRVVGPEPLLTVAPRVSPATVRLIGPEEYRWHHQWIYLLGGISWLAGVICLFWRWLQPPRRPL